MALIMVEDMNGEAAETFKVDVDDTSNNLVDDESFKMLGVTNKKVIQSLLLTCETNDVRISFGTEAVQTGGSEVGHILSPGSSIKITNPKNIRAMRYINKTNGSNSVLMITAYYSNT